MEPMGRPTTPPARPPTNSLLEGLSASFLASLEIPTRLTSKLAGTTVHANLPKYKTWDEVAAAVQERASKPARSPPQADAKGAAEYSPRCLDGEDMDLFGLLPMADPLQLVTCLHCTKVVKASRFCRHMQHCPKTPDHLRHAGIPTVNGKGESHKRKLASAALPTPPAKVAKLKSDSTPSGPDKTSKPRVPNKAAPPLAESSSPAQPEASSASSRVENCVRVARMIADMANSKPVPLATRTYTKRNPLHDIALSFQKTLCSTALTSHQNHLTPPRLSMGSKTANKNVAHTQNNALTLMVSPGHFMPTSKGGAVQLGQIA